MRVDAFFTTFSTDRDWVMIPIMRDWPASVSLASQQLCSRWAGAQSRVESCPTSAK